MTLSPSPRKRRNQAPVIIEEVTSVFLSGAFSKTLVAPLERVKLILQNQPLIHVPEKNRFKGVLDALWRLPGEQGFFAFWRGNGTNILRTIPTSAVRFISYDRLNRAFLPKGDRAYTGFERGTRKLTAASISGILTIALTYPLDLAKTRLSMDMSKFHEQRQYKGMIGCMKKVARTEGIFGLYKGFWISCVGIVPYLAFSLGAYDFMKPYLFESDVENLMAKAVAYLGAGTIAVMTAQFFTYPLDTVRRRMQLNGGLGLQKAYKNSFDCIKKIAMMEGVKGFYKGITPNLVKIPPAAAIQFATYDVFKGQFSEERLM